MLAAPAEVKPFLKDPNIGALYLNTARKAKIGRVVDGYVAKHGKV